MAIVKVKYTRDPIKIKEHLRYIVHRPGKDRETLSRELFDAFDRTDKTQAYERIDATKHPLFFKFILNFDAKKEDTFKDLDLQHITRQTLRQMQRLIGRDVPFVAVMHDDHTSLRHVHAIGMVQGRIARADFAKIKTLYQTATAEARKLRRQRDRVREHPRVQFLTQARIRTQPVLTKRREQRYKPLRIQHGCYHCGYGEMSGIPSHWQYCPSCHKPLNQEKTLHLELSKQL
jgi:AraC-like DNA-binding protein